MSELRDQDSEDRPYVPDSKGDALRQDSISPHSKCAVYNPTSVTRGAGGLDRFHDFVDSRCAEEQEPRLCLESGPRRGRRSSGKRVEGRSS